MTLRRSSIQDEDLPTAILTIPMMTMNPDADHHADHQAVARPAVAHLAEDLTEIETLGYHRCQEDHQIHQAEEDRHQEACQGADPQITPSPDRLAYLRITTHALKMVSDSKRK